MNISRFNQYHPYSRALAAPHFRGAKATQLVRDTWLGSNTQPLADALAQDTDPLVGEFPDAFKSTGLPDAELTRQMDQLSSQLRNLYNSVRHQDPEDIKPGAKQAIQDCAKIFPFPVSIEYLGSKNNNMVVKLTVHGVDYALRVAIKPQQSLRPIAASAFINTPGRGPFKDFPAFFVANPNAGWMLREYIDKDTTDVEKRPGERYLADGGFYLADDEDETNRVKEVIVDPDLMIRP